MFQKLWSTTCLSYFLSSPELVSHEDLSYSSSIVKDETNAEAENENLPGLEGEISENGDNMSMTATEEVSKISENIIACDDKREEEKIQMEDVSQESLAEKIISRPENTAEKVTQIEHPSHESTAELGASPDSPAEEISEEYSDHREAKQLPEEISENLSILSKEIKTDHLDQSIYPSIDENETTAAGENEKLAVEEHTDDKNIVGAKSATFQDDNTELKITQLEDASPEPMEENFVTQTNTEDYPKTEETSIKFTEDEYVKGSSADSSVPEGHIEEDEEGKKQFPEEKYENLCKESKEEGKEHEDLIHDTSKCETSPGGDEERLKVQEHPKVEKSTKASTMTENIVQGENAGEEKIETEHISKNIAEVGHVTSTSTETSFEKIVESDIDDVKDIEKFPEEMSANGEDEHLTSEASPEEGKIIEEASPVAVNIISQDNKNEEKETRMEGTNAQSPGESNLVDTAPESLAEGKAESSADDVHEAMEGTSEHYKEESNLEETLSEPLAEKEAEIFTEGKGFTEELTTMGGESFAVEYSAVEGEHEDLNHDSSTLDHAMITMEDNEEVIVEKKLKKDENITEEAPISAGNTIHQEDDSIDAVKMHQEDGPKTSMEGSATPLDDNTEGQNADEKSTEASSKAGNKVSWGEIADEEKEESEHISKIITEDDPQTGTSTETSFEKIVDSNIDDVEVIEEFPEEMSANEDNGHLRSETSPEDGKIIEEASPVAVNIISQDNENEEKEMQMESTNAQGPDESNVDTPPETLAGGKAESSTDHVHEAMEGTREQYKEESNLEDTPSEPLAEKEAETSTDDGHEGKRFTEELTTGGASLYVEHAAVDREHEDLDHDLSISDHATITMEDNEEVIEEEKLKSDDNITGEAPLSAGNTIHQEDDSIDAVKIHLEDGRETSMEGSATPLDVKTSGQNAQIQDSNEELTRDEDATGLLPGYPSEDVLQTSTNKEKECSSEQKCENLLTESTEIEKDHEDAVHDSSPIDGTAKEYVKLTADETVTNEMTTDGASSSIVAEVIHNDTALNKAEEFLPITLSPDDKGTDQKARTEDKTEQATDTVKGINELADLDKFENDNDQLQKEEAPEASEEITEEYNMETDQEELTRESPDENIVNISGDDGKRKNELNEENTENHSVEHTAIGEGHEDLGLQTSYIENVTSKGENNDFEKEETPEKEKIIEAKSLSAAKNSIPRDYNNEEKMEIEDVTYESVEGSTVSEDYNAEEKDTQKDDISQPIEENHATVTSAEVPIEVDHETYATDGNKAKENITEECEILTAGSTQEYNEMLTTQKDTKEETVQIPSSIIGETMADNISLNNNEQFLSTDSSNEGEGTEQTSMKDMAEDKTDTKNRMKEQNDLIQREVKEQPAEIMEQEKIEEEAVLNDGKVIEGVGKEDLKSPAEEYEESASRESAEGILIATTSQLEETTISLSTEEDIVDSEKKICQELTDFPNDKLKFCADGDAKEDMTTEESSLRNSSVHNREDAFDLSGQEEGNEKQQTDEATCERSESINIEVHQDPQTDEDRSIVENSKKEVNLLSEPVVDVVTNNQRELESKTQETGSIEETELFTINDQQRETDNSEVSEEIFGKANADERITEQCKELDSFHNLEASERGTVSEKTTEHVEPSSIAATGHAADDDFITEDHGESFSLGQKVSGKHNADEEEHDVPDEAPDAKEKKEEEEEESASSATQLGDVVELNKETNIEPIKEVNGGTTEAIERNNEVLVARNKDVDYQENAEYQIDNDLQHDEMKTPTSLESIQSEVQEAKYSTNITETESSDIMETPYSQPEASTVAETADECDLVEEISQSSQITTERNNEPSENRIKENLESATLIEKHENKTATVNEEVNEILSKHPADVAKEDVTEEKLRCEVTPTEETETNLDVGRSTNREVNENGVLEDLIMTNQVPIEPEDLIMTSQANQDTKNQVPMEPENEDKVLTAQEAAENMSDANELWHNEIKSVISSKSVQIGNEQAPDSNHKHEIESSEKVETLYNNSETSTVAETFEEFGVPDETGQSSKNNTKGEHQLRQRNKKNLESANLAAKIEHETTDIYGETNGKLTKHPASSTEEDMKTGRSRSEVTPTEDIDTNSKVVMEPENEEKSKGIQELSEEQKEATNFQQDEMKSVTRSTSVQNESENATNFDKISETEILGKMGTPFNQSEASAGTNTLEEAGLSDVVEGETAFESQSHTSFQDVGKIRQDGMGAKEIPQPTEVEEQLQETLSQLVPVEEKHIAPVEVIGETATDLKPLQNVREEKPFSELVLHEQKHKGSLPPKDIAEVNTERFQSLEGKSTAYSVLEQIKDEKWLQEEVPKEPDTQSLDFKTSKKLHLKEETTQETSTTDSKIIMQARDFSTEIQCTGFSQVQDSEKTTEADTSIHSSLEETKDDEKARATIIKEEQGHFGKAMLQSEENSLATLQTDSSGKHKGEENWHVLSVEDALVTMEEAAIEEEQGPEEREKKGESMPTGETIIQSSDWHQVSAAEMSQMEGYSSKDEIAIDETEKVDHNEEDKIGRSEPVEKEADVGDLSREVPGSIIAEASKDIKVKATQKKSHNILSSVGSKVKHSISKVKKAITGKPSQPKNTSPKKATTPREN